jgi:hypothetical protein
MDKRSEYSQTWQMSNGALQTTFTTAPIHSKDQAGVWQPINPDLVSTGARASYRTTSAPVTETISDRLHVRNATARVAEWIRRWSS